MCLTLVLHLLLVSLLQPRDEVSQDVNTLTCMVRDGEDGSNLSFMYYISSLSGTISVFNMHWKLTTVLLENLGYLLHVFSQDLRWSNIYLGKDHEYRKVERDGNKQVLHCHSRQSHVSTDENHGVIREETIHSMHGGLKILLVTTHVKQVNDLFRIFDDVCLARSCFSLRNGHILSRTALPHG